MIITAKLRTALLASALLGFAATPLAATTTDPTGSGTPFSTYQPGLALTQNFDLQGIYPSRDDPGDMLGGGTTFFSLGMVRTLATGFNSGDSASDGRHLDIGTHSSVFSLVGVAYGGNGTSDFAVPDLRGRAIVGASAATQLALNGYNVGQATGAATTVLDMSQIPGHSHSLPGGGNTGVTGGGMAFSHARRPCRWSI